MRVLQGIAPPGFCEANNDVPLFSRVWMQRLRRDARTHQSHLAVAHAYRDAQLAWLRATLTDEGAPQWLIDAALERW